MPISAKVILKSSSQYATKPLCTFELRYPKFVHAEFMTHRMLSRNASSSRAIPTKKLIAEVLSDSQRAQPIFWGKNQKGMQAVEELAKVSAGGGLSDYQLAQAIWKSAALNAIDAAENLVNLDAHKQIVNRILEPFSHINVVATATEWDNFFGLRLHWMAQPEMRELAKQMWKAYNEAETQMLEPGQWHLPYIDMEEDGTEMTNYSLMYDGVHDLEIKMSVARCARVSFKSLESNTRSTPTQDMETYKKLNIPGTEFYQSSEPIHASPAEHQATPDSYCHPEMSRTNLCGWEHLSEHGNFVGWRQYRKMLPGESCAPLPDEYLPF